MLPHKIFKIMIFNLAENELLTTKFPDFLGKFPDLQGSLSNSLTFPGFPGQWQPYKAVTFQQFFSWFCFVPLWFSLSYGFASWEGSLVLAFYGQNKTDQMWPVCLQVQVENFQMSALELGKSWGIALVLIMKYLLKKPSKIFSLRINAKCLKNNLNN